MHPCAALTQPAAAHPGRRQVLPVTQHRRVCVVRFSIRCQQKPGIGGMAWPDCPGAERLTVVDQYQQNVFRLIQHCRWCSRGIVDQGIKDSHRRCLFIEGTWRSNLVSNPDDLGITDSICRHQLQRSILTIHLAANRDGNHSESQHAIQPVGCDFGRKAILR